MSLLVEREAPSPLQPLFKYWNMVIKSPQSLPCLKAEQRQFSQPVLTCQDSQAFDHLCDLLWTPCSLSTSILYNWKKTEHKIPSEARQALIEQDNGLVISAGDALDVTQSPVTFLYHSSPLVAQTELCAPGPQVPSHTAAPQMDRLSPCCTSGVRFSRGSTRNILYSLLAEICEVLINPLFQLIQAFLQGVSHKVSTSSSLSSANFVGSHLIPSSRWLMDILNSTEHNINPEELQLLPVWKGTIYQHHQPVAHTLHEPHVQTITQQFLLAGGCGKW